MADPQSRAATRYASAELLRWTDALHAAHDNPLRAAFEAADGERVPAIMVSPSEGRLLELLMRLLGARRVVEVGTLVGYSAIHLARGLPDDGHLWTLEADPAHAEIARRNLALAGLAEKVTVLVGPALASLPSLEAHAPFDAVFLDADKGNYDAYARWAASQLRPGGMILGDNAYYFGKLLDESDPSAEAMRRFHALVAERFDSVCVPTPDGLVMGLRRD